LRWDANALLSPDALYAHGALTASLYGFIDCTIRPTCRPGKYQELMYTGYKKCHRMKFQGIIIPNSLIAHLEGPFCAPQNDMGVFAESGLASLMQKHAIQPGSRVDHPPKRQYFQLYSDLGYGMSLYLLSPYSGIGEQTAEEHAWNTQMGTVRISIEHGFGSVLQDWPYLRTTWKHQILGNSCGLFYRVGVLLTNTHACVAPNQTTL